MPIKVFIPTKKFKGGPAAFRSRLISVLNRLEEIEIVTDVNNEFDIGLEFIRKTGEYEQPHILRMSSCYYLKKYKPWNNKPIGRAAKKAQHVIFQSKFGYKLCDRVLRLESRGFLRNGYSIIHNGIDLDYIKNIRASSKIESGSIIACARWDANKRLKSMLKGFLSANIKRHLYIVGGFGIESRKDNFRTYKKKYKSKYIHFIGKKINEEIISMMKACDYQIHLSFIDICPNTVIEGLACGLNVLCTNLGGTAELVRDSGVILNVDKFWETKYLKKKMEDLDNIPSSVVAEGIHELLKRKKKADVSVFDINNIAKKYMNVIRKYGT